jgi:hypothetical protein
MTFGERERRRKTPRLHFTQFCLRTGQVYRWVSKGKLVGAVVLNCHHHGGLPRQETAARKLSRRAAIAVDAAGVAGGHPDIVAADMGYIDAGTKQPLREAW